ncbi:dihydrodipicolinate synthase family protein [Poriferisphaera sp. WC338]|uniref:dihydrodipicolinate synthase family protein n=1 Tax=Poriferisphaera sp. WC338 TaxID=3425129 RepID=UPI003D8169EB
MKDKRMANRHNGLVAAVFSPVETSGKLALDRIPTIVSHLIDNGIGGLLVGGLTGEYASFSDQERMALHEAYVNAANNQIPIIAHVGHDVLESAKELARHAESIGADEILTSCPRLFKPASEEALCDWCAPISAAAPNTPMFFYNSPVISGSGYAMTKYIEFAKQRIPTFRGIKFSAKDLYEMNLCLQMNDDACSIYFGCDEMLLAALAMGANAATGSTYNYAAPLFCQLLDHYEAGEMSEAQACMSRINQMISLLHEYGGGIIAGKAIMKMVGVDCGPTRLPLKNLSDAEYNALQDALTSIGFFDWLKTANTSIAAHT